MKILMIAVSTLALVGCTMDGRPTPLPGPVKACNADRVQRFLGQRATPALVNTVRRQSGAVTARRITPQMRVTMDYREDRINVWVSLKGTAERINCG